MSNIHAHLVTTIDCDAEFVQEDETGDTDKAAEKDSESIVHPKWEPLAVDVKITFAIQNEPVHVEPSLYKYR